MNKIIVTGNLTQSPTLGESKSVTTYTKVGIAVKRPYSKNDEVDFFNLVAWGKTAEFICKYFQKGSRALVEGRLQTSNYTDNDGNKRVSYEINVADIEFADSKKKSAEPAETDTSGNDDVNDLPF